MTGSLILCILLFAAGFGPGEGGAGGIPTFCIPPGLERKTDFPETLKFGQLKRISACLVDPVVLVQVPCQQGSTTPSAAPNATSTTSTSAPSNATVGLTTQSASNGSTNAPMLCQGARSRLIDGLYNCSVNLTATQNASFFGWVQSIQESIIINTNWPSKKRFKHIWRSFKKFGQQGQDKQTIYRLLKYCQIDGFMSFRDVDFLSRSFDKDSLNVTIVFNSIGSNPLIDALKNAANQSGNATVVSDTNSLIANITAAIRNSSFPSSVPNPNPQPLNTTNELFGIIHQLLKAFLAAHPNVEQEFSQQQMDGFDDVQSFLDVSESYARANSADQVNANVIIVALQNAVSNPAQPIPPPFSDIIQSIISALQSYSSQQNSQSLILQFFANITSNYTMANPPLAQYLKSVQLTVNGQPWGEVGDLVFASATKFPNENFTVSWNESDWQSGSNATSDQSATIASPANTSVFDTAIGASWQWNKTVNYFGYQWGLLQWSTFQNYRKNCSATINNPNLSNATKLQTIYKVIKIYLGANANASWLACIPLPGYGFLGQLLTNQNASDTSLVCPLSYPQALCSGTSSGLVNYNPSSNSTPLEDSINSQLSSDQQRSYFPLKDKIRNVLGPNSPYSGPGKKLRALSDIILGNTDEYPYVLNFKIAGWGTVKRLLDCQQQYSSN